MRILHVVTRFLSAGSERNILGQMCWERAQGHEVHLAVGRDSNTTDLDGLFEVHHLPALVRSVSPRLDLAARSQIRGLVGSQPFDVLHSHQSKAGVLGREAARGRVPTLLHTVHMSPFGPGYAPLASAAFATAERFCARFTSMIICVGEELRDVQLRASIGRPEQYRVIRSPIDVDRFAAARDVRGAAREALRARFGVRPGAKVAVAVGALEARKRHALIVGELAGLIRAGHVDLLIAGDGPEREPLGRLAASLAPDGGVRLLGHVGDVPDLLAASDLLVHASTAEGVPQVVIQALAAGLPVVATEVVGLREVPGAPVRVLPPDGAGIASAVQQVAEGPPQPAVPLSALDPWRPSSVEDQIASMHREVVALRRA